MDRTRHDSSHGTVPRQSQCDIPGHKDGTLLPPPVTHKEHQCSWSGTGHLLTLFSTGSGSNLVWTGRTTKPKSLREIKVRGPNDKPYWGYDTSCVTDDLPCRSSHDTLSLSHT